MWSTDVLAFIKTQREPRRGATVVRIEDGESELSGRTSKRRLASIAGLYEYLIIRSDTAVARTRCQCHAAWRCAGRLNARCRVSR